MISEMVYVMNESNGMVKVGMSKDPIARLSQIKSNVPSVTLDFVSFPVSNAMRYTEWLALLTATNTKAKLMRSTCAMKSNQQSVRLKR